jgi:hypothetical protein
VDNNEGERVAYLRPPAENVREAAPAVPGWIVIPRFAAGASLTLEAMPRSRALLHLADNSFNYNLHGRQGFERLADIVDRAPCVTLRYSRLGDGVEAVDRLAQGPQP